MAGKFLQHALRVWTNRRVLGRSAGFPAGPACGSIHLYDRWRLRSIEELEMRLGGAEDEVQILSLHQTVKRRCGFYVRKNVR